MYNLALNAESEADYEKYDPWFSYAIPKKSLFSIKHFFIPINENFQFVAHDLQWVQLIVNACLARYGEVLLKIKMRYTNSKSYKFTWSPYNNKKICEISIGNFIWD